MNNKDIIELSQNIANMAMIVENAISCIDLSIRNLSESITNTIENISTMIDNMQMTSNASENLNILSNGFSTLSSAVTIASEAHTAFQQILRLNPYVKIATAIAGVTAALVSLSSIASEETKRHNEAMDVINKEAEARSQLKAVQQEQLSASLSEMGYVQNLSAELKTLVKAGGKVAEGDQARASFIISTLNSALGEQIKMENGIVSGYDESSNATNNKIALLKAEAILEAQLPAYKKAITEATNAQTKAAELENDISLATIQQKSLESELIKEYGKDYMSNRQALMDSRYREMSSLAEETSNKQIELDKQNEIVSGYYEDISLYETNAALIASGTAEDLAKVQMESVSTKAETLEAKKGILLDEINAENEHINYLKEMRATETDEEIQRQLDAQIQNAELRAAGYQEEIDSLTAHGEQIAELGKIKNVNELDALGIFIADKQQKLVDMYAVDESKWTEQQRKEAEDLQNSINANMDLYSKFAYKKVDKSLELTKALNENSTQQERDAAESAQREALTTLNILGEDANNKLAILADLKEKRAAGDKSITKQMIKEAENQASEAESKYGDVADKINKSWKNLPKDSQKAFEDVMKPMLEEMQKKEAPLFEKSKRIADGILDRLKKSFDIHSPSRKVRQIFQYVMEGAEIGLDDRTPELLKQTDAISSDVLESFLNLDVSEVNRMVDKMQDAFHRENFKINGLIQSSYSHELMTTGKLHVDVPELKATLKGNLENHISIDGRETAVALTPFISEEIAFQGGL